MASAPVGWEVARTVPGDVDHGTPFFISYARAPETVPGHGAAHDPDQLVERFFRDLSENIAQLIGLKVGMEPGFMDRTMRGGMRWTEELLHAVGTCQVLVALLSAPYLASEWCGMEWHAFSQRPVQRSKEGSSPRQGCIIPVIWAPVPQDSLPPQIRAEMLFIPKTRPDPEVTGQYRENGIFGLMRMAQETPYQIVVWQLAQHISHVYHSQWVEFHDFAPEDLCNVFQGENQ